MLTETKVEPGMIITASALEDGALYKVVVIYRFDSGNFHKTEHPNLSRVAAEGLVKFYTV